MLLGINWRLHFGALDRHGGTKRELTADITHITFGEVAAR